MKKPESDSEIRNAVEEVKPARHRGRGLGLRRPPKFPPRSIAEIWRAASEEERLEAKRKSMEILSYWRGLVGSRQVASNLGIKQNLVYQLQQRALAGMVAGLLSAPSPRTLNGKPAATELDLLKREVETLRREKDGLTGLVRLLRNLPGAPRVEDTRSGKGKGKGDGRTEKDRRRPKPLSEVAQRGAKEPCGA